MTFSSRDTGNEARHVALRAYQARMEGARSAASEKEAAIRADLRNGKAGIIELLAAHCVGVGTGQQIKAALRCRGRALTASSRP